MSARISRILAATDLSRPAFNAVRRAAALAREQGVGLDLLYVMPSGRSAPGWKELLAAAHVGEEDVRAASGGHLREVAALVEAEFQIAVVTHVAEGKPYVEIARRIEALDSELAVIGARGENAMIGSVLGTTAHRVLGHSGCPVLVVGGGQSAAYERVVFATVFSDHAVWAAAYARRIVRNARFELIHVCEPLYRERWLHALVPEAALLNYRERVERESHQRLHEFANAAHIRDAVCVVRHGPPALRIREHAQEIGADLIVLAPQDRKTALGSVSTQLVTHAHCDVLLV